MRAFKTIRTQNRELMSIQDNIQDALKIIDLSLILDGVQIGPVTIGTTNTVIAHTLNRMPLGWILVRPKAEEIVWEVSMNSSNLTLIASNPIQCHLWVY